MNKPMTDEQRALYEVAIDPERTDDFMRGVAMTMWEYKVNHIKVIISFVLGLIVGILL